MKRTTILICWLIIISALPAQANITFDELQGSTRNINLWDIDWHPTCGIALIVGSCSGCSQDESRVYIYDSRYDSLLNILPSDSLNKEYKGVAWHPEGNFALLVGDNHALVKYDPFTDSFTELPTALNGNIDLLGVEARPVQENGTYYFYITANFFDTNSTYYSTRVYRTDGIDIDSSGYLEIVGSSWVSQYASKAYKMAWKPDGAYMLIADDSSSGRGLWIYDPLPRNFDNGQSDAYANVPMYNTSSNQSGPYANYYSIGYKPTSDFALFGSESWVYRVNGGIENGSNVLLFNDVYAPTGPSAPVNQSYVTCWDTQGRAALFITGNSYAVRFDSTGDNEQIFDMTHISFSRLFAGEWIPNCNQGLLVGENSQIIKFQDNSLSSGSCPATSSYCNWESPPPPSCSPPASDDWIITADCILDQSYTAQANVEVTNNSTLTIIDDVTLDIDLINYNLTVRNGSGVLIKQGGKID